jgi:hypothetical protein
MQTMSKNPFDGDDFKRWADDMRRRLIPDMKSSAHILMIAPSLNAEFDIEFALQIGACILLEKPLIVLVHPNRTIPPKLKAIADRIIEVDLSDPENNAAGNQIRQALTDFGKQ